MGWLWFLGTLVPMIGLVQVGHQAMADRYAYLPFVGLFIMLCWGVGELGGAAGKFRSRGRRRASVAVLLALGGAHTSSDRLLERQCAAVDAHAAGHQCQLPGRGQPGPSAAGAKAKPQDAMPHFARAAEIAPSYVFAYIHMGIYQHQQGDLQVHCGNTKK